MVKIGRINKLTIKTNRDDGIYLDGGKSGDILLPKKHVPDNCRPGDEIEVFVYANKSKRLQATTQKPYATVGQFAKLRVISSSSQGVYLDWGLQKDLLIPKGEQSTKMEEGKAYIVFIFLDESTNRIAASTKLDKFITILPPNYDENEEVDLIICAKTDLGYKAIINNSHWGVIYKNEVFQKINIGQQLKGYIKKIREDFKIDLSLQKAGYQRVDDISNSILKAINNMGGSITVTDKSPPDDIYALFMVSKKTFKKAIGALYKRKLITIDTNGIKLVSHL